MIYTTKELLNKGETEYSIRNKVASGSLYVIARGVYSDELDSYIDELYYATRYPNAIITGISAFYIYELTDNIPDKIHVASEQHSYPIRNTNIVQSYQEASFLKLVKQELHITTDTSIFMIKKDY